MATTKKKTTKKKRSKKTSPKPKASEAQVSVDAVVGFEAAAGGDVLDPTEIPIEVDWTALKVEIERTTRGVDADIDMSELGVITIKAKDYKEVSAMVWRVLGRLRREHVIQHYPEVKRA